jgi:uroporphyrinogen decarboxylase
MLRGQQELYTDLIDISDTVKDKVRIINEVLHDYCDALIDAGADAIMFDTLFASASIMMWKEFKGVFLTPLCNHIRAKGAAVMIHNCGYKIYFDAQIECMSPAAISFLHVPDDCSDFAECKKKYGDITLIGAIPPTVLPSISYDELIEMCREQIKTFGAGSRFVLATGCEYPANMSLDKAKAFLEAATSAINSKPHISYNLP